MQVVNSWNQGDITSNQKGYIWHRVPPPISPQNLTSHVQRMENIITRKNDQFSAFTQTRKNLKKLFKKTTLRGQNAGGLNSQEVNYDQYKQNKYLLKKMVEVYAKKGPLHPDNLAKKYRKPKRTNYFLGSRKIESFEFFKKAKSLVVEISHFSVAKKAKKDDFQQASGVVRVSA